MPDLPDEQTQLEYTRTGIDAARHCIDLHWEAVNTPLFAGIWQFADLRQRARSLPRLAPGALGLSRVDAYLQACLHWASNRHVPYHIEGSDRIGGDRLIWLLDLQKLADALDQAQVEALVGRARSLGIAGLCRAATRAAEASWPHPRLQALVDQLSPSGLEWRSLALGGRWWRRGIAEFLVSVGQGRMRPWLRAHLWRNEAQLRARYPDAAGRSAWQLQLRRLLDGLRKRLKR